MIIRNKLPTLKQVPTEIKLKWYYVPWYTLFYSVAIGTLLLLLRRNMGERGVGRLARGRWRTNGRKIEEKLGGRIWEKSSQACDLCNLERITMPAYCPCCLAIHCVNYTVILSHCRRLYLTPAPLLHMASQKPQIHSAETVTTFCCGC